MTSVAAPPGLSSGADPARPRADLWGRWLAGLERSHRRAAAALVALCLACFLPGFVSLQPMDRDEPRFAQATKQMLETGDLIDIRFQDEARHKKPVGIHWLQAASVAAGEALGVEEARTTIALYRLPSLLGAIAGVLLTYWAALAFLARREALLAAALMAAAIVLAAEARLAKTDAVLFACTTAAMGGLARAYLARSVRALPGPTLALFWGGFALGILVKGPMVIVFAGLAALVLCWRERSLDWLRALRPKLGLLVTAAVVLPWFVAIAVKSGGAFYTAAVGDDMLGKVATGQQKHWGPPGYYGVAYYATFWPGAALAVIAAPFLWRNRGDDRIAFAIAWTLPAWLVLELVSTKLPHYVLPLYPAVAIAIAIAIAGGGITPRHRFARAVALLIPFIPAALLVGLGFAAWSLDRTWPAAGLALVALSAVIAGLAWRLFSRSDARGAAFTGVAASVCLSAGVIGAMQPALPSLKVSPRLAAVARGLGCAEPRIATLGYREPSLVFLVGTDLIMHETADEAADFLAAGGCRLVFVESRFAEAFREAGQRRGLAATPLAQVNGFNINGGRRVEIAAYTARP